MKETLMTNAFHAFAHEVSNYKDSVIVLYQDYDTNGKMTLVKNSLTGMLTLIVTKTNFSGIAFLINDPIERKKDDIIERLILAVDSVMEDTDVKEVLDNAFQIKDNVLTFKGDYETITFNINTDLKSVLKLLYSLANKYNTTGD